MKTLTTAAAILMIFLIQAVGFNQTDQWADTSGIPTWTNGKVGIGLTNPNNYLHVYGNAYDWAGKFQNTNLINS